MISKVKIAASFIAGVMLVGCASTKPQLSLSAQDSFAEEFVEIQLCGQRGMISPDSALWAKRLTNYNLSTWNYDSEFVNAQYRKIIATHPGTTSEQCNQIAMRSEEYKQNVLQNNAQVEATTRALQNQIQNNRPVTTYCNRIGTQTFCNSY